MIFVLNCILSGCTVTVFIPKYKIMVRGEADWKRGTWNECFYPDKSGTDVCSPCGGQRWICTSRFSFFSSEHVVFSAVPSMSALWNLPVCEAEEVKEPPLRGSRRIKMFRSHMFKMSFCLNDTFSSSSKGMRDIFSHFSGQPEAVWQMSTL